MIVGCEWGDKVATDDDPNRCLKGAVGVVAVKDGSRIHAIKVCMSHRMVLMSETSAL